MGISGKKNQEEGGKHTADELDRLLSVMRDEMLSVSIYECYVPVFLLTSYDQIHLLQLLENMYNSLSPVEVEQVQNIKFSKEATDKIEGRQKVRQRAGKNQVHVFPRTTLTCSLGLNQVQYMTVFHWLFVFISAASLTGCRSGIALVHDGARRSRKHSRPESVPRGAFTTVYSLICITLHHFIDECNIFFFHFAEEHARCHGSYEWRQCCHGNRPAAPRRHPDRSVQWKTYLDENRRGQGWKSGTSSCARRDSRWSADALLRVPKWRTTSGCSRWRRCSATGACDTRWRAHVDAAARCDGGIACSRRGQSRCSCKSAPSHARSLRHGLPRWDNQSTYSPWKMAFGSLLLS